MRILRAVFLLAFLFPMDSVNVAAHAGDNSFPVSSKGVQATIVAVSGRNTSQALAIGQVQNANLWEYCNRDPGGMTTRYGGRMSISQCVKAMNREVGGTKYSARANCPQGTVSGHLGTYKLLSKKYDGMMDGIRFTKYVWSDENSGDVLDGSEASGAPTVTDTYRMLCPSFNDLQSNPSH